MKIFISADIEGIAGITSWEEADPHKSQYRPFQERMTEEVKAACLGALDAGAKEIWVRDAHWFARNLLHERLPREVRLIRGWSRHPYMMVQEIDPSFEAAAFIGYHSEGGSGANPLAHTLTDSVFQSIRINGQPVAEFHLYAGAAALEGVRERVWVVLLGCVVRLGVVAWVLLFVHGISHERPDWDAKDAWRQCRVEARWPEEAGAQCRALHMCVNEAAVDRERFAGLIAATPGCRGGDRSSFPAGPGMAAWPERHHPSSHHAGRPWRDPPPPGARP